MPIVASIILRIIYLATVLFIAFWLGIGIAMGFDSGVNLIACLLVLVHLLTFIPAFSLGFLPTSKITNPPFTLKIWYGWLCLLGIIYTVIWLFAFFAAIIHSISWNNQHPSGTVCFQILDAPPSTQVWIDIGSPPELQLRKFGGSPLSLKPFCGFYGLSMNPLQIQVYSANESNKKKTHASPEDNPSDLFSIPISENEKTCVGIFPNSSASPTKWITKIIDCKH